jgi:arylsulfatase A-like enzyme
MRRRSMAREGRAAIVVVVPRILGTGVLLLALAACDAGNQGRGPDGTPASTDAAQVKKVLVIGIDGVRPDVLARVPTPNVDALAATGTFSDVAQTGQPTVSGPGWSSLLIGVWPAKHGVTNNDFTGERYDRYPDFLTRIERARPELVTFAAVDWVQLAADTLGGPVISAAIDDRQVFDGYVHGWAEADSLIVDVSVRRLRDSDVDAAFVYLGNPDETSHESGSIGEEYEGAIALSDRHVGMLIDAVRARPTYEDEDWLILVSTDHGRRPDGGHGGDTPGESTIFYIASGPSAAVGRPASPPGIVDVAVTALAHVGIEIDPAWELDGRVVGLRR